eukprot:3167092-Prymnesium_polylepis.1
MLARAARTASASHWLISARPAAVRCRCLASSSSTPALTANDILKHAKQGGEVKYVVEADRVAEAAERMIQGGVGSHGRARRVCSGAPSDRRIYQAAKPTRLCLRQPHREGRERPRRRLPHPARRAAVHGGARLDLGWRDRAARLERR